VTDTEQERARIRALVVARMNMFVACEQQYRDEGDHDGAHAWSLAQKGMRGLLEEIDNGAIASDLIRRKANQ
jgi:hypothetical protein